MVAGQVVRIACGASRALDTVTLLLIAALRVEVARSAGRTISLRIASRSR